MGIEFTRPEGYFSGMRRLWMWLTLVGVLTAAWGTQAATGRVVKVLPQFLDLKGRNSTTPSLYQRDTYQAYLRVHTNECSGMRFVVQWKIKGKAAAPLKVQVELRGVARGDFPRHRVLEKLVQPHGWFGYWAELDLLGEDYKDFGKVTAWRATLWEGATMLGEQKSFLW
jgi:hypothetical protein